MSILSYKTLAPALSLMCYLIVLLILIKSKRSKIIKAYSIYIITNIVWSFGSLMMRTGIYPGPLFWNRILCIGLISMPIAFYKFTLIFTQTHSENKKLYSGYGMWLILIMLNSLGYIVKEAYIVEGTLYYRLGPIAPIVAVWSLIYLVLALINVIHKIRANIIVFDKVKFVFYGLILVILGGILNLIPQVGRYPIDLLSNTINAILVAYSMYRYKFLDIKLIIRRGLIYSIYTFILAIFYVSIVFIVEKSIRTYIGYETIIAAVITSIVIAVVIHPFKYKLQDIIDKAFYKDEVAKREALKDFSNIINNTLDIEELSDSFLGIVIKGMKLKHASLMLKKENKYITLQAKGDIEGLGYFELKEDSPVVNWFCDKNKFLTIDHIDRLSNFQSLWNYEKDYFQKNDIQLFIPIKLRDELIGILLLSKKKNDENYSEDDIDLLLIIANSSAVAIENARLYSKVKEDAITDGLTGLYNHRYFHEVLSKLIDTKIMDVFSVALIDVDHFKLYNDLYGHFEGDNALSRLGEILKKCTKVGDIVARYGGEEFAIVFPNLSENEAVKEAEKIRGYVEKEFNSSKDMSKFLTVSIGIASSNSGITKEEIIKNADDALYEAKRKGKNQVVLYTNTREKVIETNHVEEKIQDAYFSAIQALAATIDAKDHYTYGHSENVSKYGVKLAKAAGLDSEQIDIVKYAGLLHDVGKIGIPEHVLTKKERLTDEEMEIMKKHVDMSMTIIKHIPNLVKVLPAILSHHERYDGNGYPRRIKGKSIPIEGRCLCIADAFDAMTTDRPYRKAMSIDEALDEIRNNKGTQFDPKLVDIFLSLFENEKIEA
ncbi:sensor domain-containing diguanylate cyclase/phosphohydrolase [Alkalithermobacter paradoxus]|uniref:Cyclic di-GMP phosphodiesterase response regulator RpfG n=1 Tax=Alkalithermobacter paradoxus TaxID=29349 RepID=A0A1V4I5P5_9FIRM|nr:cyclic di-GMP phosphodiesterase response regulator RpfG [[Clostridium] thermoalcaliphilum]